MFFFVDVYAFSIPVQFERPLNREKNPNLELRIDEKSTVDRLVANYVEWIDPDDSILNPSNLEVTPYVIDRPSTLALRGKDRYLLEHLYRNINTQTLKLSREQQRDPGPS